jgi:hypothetical protein
MRTFEQIEKDLNDIRREIKECIVTTLKSKGYGINQTAHGGKYSLQMQYDEDHTCFCLTDEIHYDYWKHIDFATIDELMELYATALRAIPR